MTLGIHPGEIVRTSTSPLLSKAPHWKRAPLGEFADILNGFAFKSMYFNKEGRGLPLIRIRDVGSREIATYYSGPYDDRYVVHPGSLIIGMDGDFRIAPWKGPAALLNQRVCKVTIRSEAMLDEFALYVLPGYLDAIQAHTSSITVKHLSSKTLLEIPMPVPPIDEQQALVAELDRHFTRLDAAVVGLQRARSNLNGYRASLLQAAVQGGFRRDSANWRWTTLGDVSDIQGGIQKQPKRAPKKNHYPYLRVANVLRGRLDLKDVHRMELFKGELDRLRLQTGDLLIVEGNGSRDQIGRMAVWRGEIDDCVHQNHIIRARPGADALPEWIQAYWNSPSGQARIVEVAGSTSGLYTLSVRKVATLPLPLPPRDEQERIVAEIERQLSVVDRLAAEVTQGLRHAEASRRAVLREAFAGRLVNGEPTAQTQAVPAGTEE